MLFERGLYVAGMTEDGKNGHADNASSYKFVLSECLDFKNQKTALQEHIENRGHICEFLPKYHPELSAIERCWAIAKKYMRGRCKFSYDDMRKKVIKALTDPIIQPISMIQKFFRKSRDYMRAYKSGVTSYRDIKVALKNYKSHRKPPDSEATDKKYKPYEKKKEIQQQMLVDKFNSLCLSAE